MFVQFTVKNFRSIQGEQVLSLVKAKGDELEESNSFSPDAPSSVPLLRSAAIYGANAAGKSNLIHAMMQMEIIVSNSASAIQEGDEIPVTPFLFDDTSSTQPTEFEMVFINEGVRYQYGFTTTKDNIEDEWLIAYPKGRPQRWFTRIFDSETKTTKYKFSDSLSGKKSVWESATRRNALFLSTAVQLNSNQLKPVFGWFKDKFRPSNLTDLGPSFTASLCENEGTKTRILSFLQAADFDIHDLQVNKERFNPDELPNDIPEFTKAVIIKELKGSTILDIKTIHKTANDKLVHMDFKEESDGTRKFFTFAGPWLETLRNGYVLVIDELHDNLHPKMVQYLIQLFHSSETNPNNAQLIFTTHETAILNQDVFRRDQVWFCEKNESQATTLYPLTDFSPRKNRENFEMGYLSGRYGALPYTKEFNFQFKEAQGAENGNR